METRFELPDEVMACARLVADHTGDAPETVLAQWIQAGMVRRLSDSLLDERDIAAEAESLEPEEERELASLFHRHRCDELTETEAERLDDLVHRYRRHLVSEAQAVTDWLALGGVRGLNAPVAELVTVRSQMLYAVGYDAKNEVLDVVFNSGGIYRYFDVPPHIYYDLLKAPSVGRYMWDNVLRTYPVVRLDRKKRSQRAFVRQQRQINQAA